MLKRAYRVGKRPALVSVDMVEAFSTLAYAQEKRGFATERLEKL